MKKLTYADIEHLPHDHPDSIEFMNQIKQLDDCYESDDDWSERVTDKDITEGRYKAKTVYVLQSKEKGVTTWDFRGTIKYQSMRKEVLANGFGSVQSTIHAVKIEVDGHIAQSVEQTTHNRPVTGSNPVVPTKSTLLHFFVSPINRNNMLGESKCQKN